jgi:hypothetical protein
MSDFDDVLERLLNEPAFAAALAEDPDLALAGYRLDAGEAALLRSQVVGDTAADVAKVETRTSKSSTFGLLAPFAALGGVVDEFGQHLAEPGGGAGAAGVREAFGNAPSAHQGIGNAPVHQGFGDAPVRQGFGDAPVRQGLGDAPVRQGLGVAPQQGFGGAPHQGLGEPSRGHAEAEQLAPPPGYANRVDADGDGHWDRATYRGGRDGGAEILVDLDHDGRADFIGHDVDLDNKVDYADYDTDSDGVFDKRMYDDDNDGWLDRTARRRSRP